jgi:hypothetical protein
LRGEFDKVTELRFVAPTAANLGLSDIVHLNAARWAAHWQRCIQEASEADIVLFVALRGERQCGALLEAGAALAVGKRVFVVSDYDWSFANHPRARRFNTIAEAVTAIMASAAGERVRQAA